MLKLPGKNLLLLLAAKNSLETLATVNAALDQGCSIGLASADVLKHLDYHSPDRFPKGIFVLNNLTVPPRHVACFTSGSTGQPKGILRSMESWKISFEFQRKKFRYGENCQVIIVGSLEHSMHLYGAMEAMDRKISPLIMTKFSPRRFVDLCKNQSEVILYATPAHLNLLLSHFEKQPTSKLECVTHILCGGAKFDERQISSLQEIFPAADIVEFFGTTETGYITIKSKNAPIGSVGKPCLGVDIKILDSKNQNLPAGETGTLWVKSDWLFDHYIIGGDDNTRWERGYLTVGDQGFLDSDGYFFYQSRKGAMVTIAGKNIFVEAIERQLQAILPRGECAIIVCKDDKRGHRLQAATQINLTQKQTTEILQNLRGKFGALATPKFIVHISEWPYLPSGKTDKAAIAKQLSSLSGGLEQ